MGIEANGPSHAGRAGSPGTSWGDVRAKPSQLSPRRHDTDREAAGHLVRYQADNMDASNLIPPPGHLPGRPR